MRYIEFIMRDKKLNFTIDEIRASKILDSNEQLIKINNENGEWSGETINKSEIIGTKVDIERTRDEHEKELQKTSLAEPQEDKEAMRKKRAELVDKFKPDFLK